MMKFNVFCCIGINEFMASIIQYLAIDRPKRLGTENRHTSSSKSRKNKNGKIGNVIDRTEYANQRQGKIRQYRPIHIEIIP